MRKLASSSVDQRSMEPTSRTTWVMSMVAGLSKNRSSAMRAAKLSLDAATVLRSALAAWVQATLLVGVPGSQQ